MHSFEEIQQQGERSNNRERDPTTGREIQQQGMTEFSQVNLFDIENKNFCDINPLNPELNPIAICWHY